MYYYTVVYKDWVDCEGGGIWTDQSRIYEALNIQEAITLAIEKDEIDTDLITKVEFIPDLAEHITEEDNNLPF